MREQMMGSNGNTQSAPTMANSATHSKPQDTNQPNTSNDREGEISPEILRNVLNGKEGSGKK